MLRRLAWFAVLMLALGCSSSQPRVVLYCAQDHEFAEPILQEFTRQTGIRVDVSTDTEANKSVSLFEKLVREQSRPRCDVFWNNEILNTLRLKQQGLLRPYRSPQADAFPEWARAPDHTWYGFAARARVLIVNKNRLKPEEYPRSIFDLTKEHWRGRVAMAKPQFGTTATHAACLFQALGKERIEQFFQELRLNVTILPGNKDVAIAVAEGRYDVGFTDTDDAIVEIERGRPVEMIFPDQDSDGIGTLFIPNTVALIKNGPNPEAAEKLLAYLLSAETEAKLAQGRSAQIPLNPKVQVDLRVKPPARIMKVKFEQAATVWEEVQTFLRKEFARGP